MQQVIQAVVFPVAFWLGGTTVAAVAILCAIVPVHATAPLARAVKLPPPPPPSPPPSSPSSHTPPPTNTK